MPTILKNNKKIVFNAGIEAGIDYAERKNAFSPKIELLFSPYGLPFVPIEIIGTEANKIIQNFTWTKDRENPGGVFSCSITPDNKIIKSIVDTINKFSGNLYSKIWGSLGVDLEDLFKPMTLCQVWINGYHIATCTIRSCIRNASVSNNSKDVSYLLIADELGNLYNCDTLSLDLILTDGLQQNIIDSIHKAYEATALIKGVSLADGINSILNAFLLSSLDQSFTLSDGLPLGLRLLALANPLGAIGNLSFADFMTLDASLFQLHSGAGGQQSLWSFLKNFIPSPWMEFFTESGGRTIVTDALGVPSVMFPGFNYVVSRSVPYSNPLLGTVNPSKLTEVLPFDLTTIQMLIGGDFIIITDDIIESKNLGFDMSSQSTVFHARYGSKNGGQVADTDKGIKSAGPLNPFASGGIKTFGIREMFQTIDSTSLIGLGTGSSYVERIARNIFGVPGQTLSKYALSNLLAVWFRNQSRFREGTVTVRNIPYARPGMYCLYLPSLSGKKAENLRDIGIYYINSLTHDYKLENTEITFTTNLNLIRGVPLPTSFAQSALLLFDFEILPPESGLWDGEFEVLKSLREAIARI